MILLTLDDTKNSFMRGQTILNHINEHKFRCVVVILILSLAGCREFLPYRTTAPEISGVLLQQGVPLPGIAVMLCAGGNNVQLCNNRKKTLTDSEGRFYFDRMREFISGISQVGDASFSYQVRFQLPAQAYQWSISGEELPDKVDLRCDISHQELCTAYYFNP